MWFQLRILINPLNEYQVRQNILYMLGSMICVGMMIYASYSEESSNIIYWSIHFYLAFRDSVRVLDFELAIQSTTNEEWWFFVVVQILGSYYHVYVLFLCFEGTRLRNISVFLLLWFIVICLLANIYPDTLVKSVMNHFFQILVINILFSFHFYMITDINDDH
jgi:hypothetical protein